MKIQVCLLQKTEKSEKEFAIAFLSIGFDFYDVEFIIDKNGIKQKNVWNYELINRPMLHIDTNYF